MEKEVIGCIDVVMHCDEDVYVTLRDIAFMPGVPFNLGSFNVSRRCTILSLTAQGRIRSMGVCCPARIS